MTSLRIALTADPYIPVPPKFYGGIERIVHLLAEHLVARGHQVTLIAHPDSDVPGTSLVPYGVPPHNGSYRRAKELAQVGGYLWRHRGHFDVVHSFGRLAALTPILPWRGVPKIQSYQRPVPWRSVRRATQLGGVSLQFTACSASMFAGQPQEHVAGRWRAIFNAVDVAKYTFVRSMPSDAPLVYLGKIERMKGVHVAIAIARGSGRRLIIAGNTVETGPDHEYFTDEILPAVDGSAVEYIGPVDDRQKSLLLGTAAALVFPTAYPEAFGIVMAEAMACGTPVIGSSRGALPEVLREGANGFLCDTVEQGIAAVAKLETIDRAAVRRDCETRFDAGVIASQYEALYAEVAAR
jgi:glycosyltransferase involved in cell wall biosynthesis